MTKNTKKEDAHIRPYPWQEEALRVIFGCSAVLSAPTGTGKTLVAYRWAGLIDGSQNATMPPGRVIFTAPIKALSNERYLDLKRMGFDVGLETGDFKKNPKAKVLCCTQEIYTLKYKHIPNQKVIIDEFHYIFGDVNRTRAYIDGIRGTSQASDMLVMSATFGDPLRLKTYLEEMGRRNFALYETSKRVTKLIYRKRPIKLADIHDALVFVFSKKWADVTAVDIARTRPQIPAHHRARLREMAEILEVSKVPEVLLSGVGVYYGSLLPKEKLMVEMAFRERILDVVVGTDALSLGVNLPAETVIFAQMAKFIDGPISKNEFTQMSGRAGRKGFFDTGYVTYLQKSKGENYQYDTKALYKEILDAPFEPAKIILRPAMGRLLKKEVTSEDEARLVADCSLPPLQYKAVYAEVEELLLLIRRTANLIKWPSKRRKLKAALGDLWFEEMSVTANIALAMAFVENEHPSAMSAAAILQREERNYLQALLKVKRYANRLDTLSYRFSKMSELDEEIEKIDGTVFGFEEKLKKLQLSESAWNFDE